VITTNAEAAIRNGYHMFASATGIDDITTVWYEKNCKLYKNSMRISSEIS